MTPKEKALELWWKYYNRIEHTLSEEYSTHESFIVKQCALIAVDEIISIKLLWFQKDTKELDYWKEIKQEIQKL